MSFGDTILTLTPECTRHYSKETETPRPLRRGFVSQWTLEPSLAGTTRLRTSRHLRVFFLWYKSLGVVACVVQFVLRSRMTLRLVTFSLLVRMRRLTPRTTLVESMFYRTYVRKPTKGGSREPEGAKKFSLISCRFLVTKRRNLGASKFSIIWCHFSPLFLVLCISALPFSG